MNKFTNAYIGNGLIINDDTMIIDGKKHKIPSHVGSSNVTIIDSRIFINGYEFKNGKWKMTLLALWHKFF